MSALICTSTPYIALNFTLEASRMCLSKSPKMPAPVAPPPPPQEAKPADITKLAKRKAPGTMTGGTALTGPSGVTGVSTGGTLLGG